MRMSMYWHEIWYDAWKRGLLSTVSRGSLQRDSRVVWLTESSEPGVQHEPLEASCM